MLNWRWTDKIIERLFRWLLAITVRFNVNKSTLRLPLGIFISIILHYSLSLLLPYFITVIPNNNYVYNEAIMNKFLLIDNLILEDLEKIVNNFVIMYTTSSSWDGNLIEISHAATIGNVIYTTHNLWLFLASFILLLVMVGAIIITITQNSKDKRGISSMVERLFYTQEVGSSNLLFLIFRSRRRQKEGKVFIFC